MKAEECDSNSIYHPHHSSAGFLIMPIQPALQLKPVSNDEFAVIDSAVMGCAYEVHNKFGRLFDERIYENDLAARLRAKGFEVHTQVPIMVTHIDFQKIYYLDLVVK
jgi:hypothetical protein